MFETIVSLIFTVGMTLLWGIAGVVVAGLPNSMTNRSLKKKRTFLLWVAGAAFLLSAAWYVTITLQFINSGWLFVEGTIKTLVPLTLVPQFYLAVKILPRLKSLRDSDGEAPTLATLCAVTHPSVRLSFYAAALASGISAFSTVFAQPVLPGPVEIAQRFILVALILFVPAIFARRRYLKVIRGEQLQRGVGVRLLHLAFAGILTAGMAITILVSNVLAGVHASKLPEASDMMNHDWIDEGGGTETRMSEGSNHHGHHQQGHNEIGTVEVAALTGNIADPADVKFELVAQRKRIELASGAVIDAWTYNGEIAPELRVKHGDMVEVKLINQDIDSGVTIHWHGYNVPNAMDGVPGMTQNVVKPGQSFTYKFRAEQEGTYWFHSHQQAAEQVVKGLFGTLIVEPKQDVEAYAEQFTVINHRWETDQGYKKAFGNHDGLQWKQMDPGKTVKLRIINTHNLSEKYLLQGTEYRIASIDGMRIQDPQPLSDQTAFRIGSGGRYDSATPITKAIRESFFIPRALQRNRSSERNPLCLIRPITASLWQTK